MDGSFETEKRGDRPPYPSLEVIYELALAQLKGRLERIDALDSRIGALLGFTAVIVALLLNAELVIGRWNWIMTAGAGLMLSGLVMLFLAFSAQPYRRDPNLRQLRERHRRLPLIETQLRVVENIVDAIRQNDGALERKAWLLNGAALLALTGLLVVAVRAIYLLQGGHP
jgi:type IV secretory pathway TrbD component